MYFDWTKISADIAAAIDFVTEHGGKVYSAESGPVATRICANGDAGVLRSIGGSWSLWNHTNGLIMVRQSIASVEIAIHTTDPEAVDAYLPNGGNAEVDWSNR